MVRYAYTVRATTPPEHAAEEFVRWMADQPADDLLRAGAEQAGVIRLGRTLVECRSICANEAASASYEAEHAARLRQIGLSRFGPNARRPLRPERSSGDVVLERDAGGAGG
ncbi:MAG: hypothetical protein ACTS22_04630 [Phycisphaerales bacterium]